LNALFNKNNKEAHRSRRGASRDSVMAATPPPIDHYIIARNALFLPFTLSCLLVLSHSHIYQLALSSPTLSPVQSLVSSPHPPTTR
jgi:hypothetical protein